MMAAAMLANNPLISGLTCADALFLDTETTGLAGGTGTMAFLIGLGCLLMATFKSGKFWPAILGREGGSDLPCRNCQPKEISGNF